MTAIYVRAKHEPLKWPIANLVVTPRALMLNPDAPEFVPMGHLIESSVRPAVDNLEELEFLFDEEISGASGADRHRYHMNNSSGFVDYEGEEERWDADEDYSGANRNSDYFYKANFNSTCTY